MSKIKLDISSWKIKKIIRRNGRMKISIKLSKDESEGFKNWSSMVRPDTLGDDEFFKQIFFNGIENLNMKLQDMSKKILSDPKMRADLQSSGVDVASIEQAMNKPIA